MDLRITAAFVAFFVGGLLALAYRRQPRPDHIVRDLVIDNNLKLKTIMATIAELSAKVDELQASIDAEQEQIAAAIAALQESIDELTANQNDPEAIAVVVAKLESAKADLEGTISDPPVDPPVE